MYDLFETKVRDWHLQKDPNFRWCAHVSQLSAFYVVYPLKCSWQMWIVFALFGFLLFLFIFILGAFGVLVHLYTTSGFLNVCIETLITTLLVDTV